MTHNTIRGAACRHTITQVSCSAAFIPVHQCDWPGLHTSKLGKPAQCFPLPRSPCRRQSRRWTRSNPCGWLARSRPTSESDAPRTRADSWVVVSHAPASPSTRTCKQPHQFIIIITSTVRNSSFSLQAQRLPFPQLLPTIEWWYLTPGLPSRTLNCIIWSSYAHRFVFIFFYHYFF